MLVTADAYKAVADALKSAAINDAKGRRFICYFEHQSGDDDGRRALVAGDASKCKQAAAATATSPVEVRKKRGGA